ncbi:hypothetical protein [Photobacterium kishitanii]|uniref:hypothetical protein n=1 Tax=Photobacterium kishitanii TaxID=318456 RepID=UPI0007F8F59A|nr:hypothetical protein [Photobacterium kishitanii]OBU31461.1 hypothetical protein AYY23_19565 [Photobacterium kishitanii]PSW45812.1 hypothetical protein C0W66_22635 [Photobacterium kishitanii]
MGIWVYDPKEKNKLFKADMGISHESINTMEVQHFLDGIKARQYWLVCDCRSPAPIMYIRRNKNGGLGLVNHSEFGIHSIDCDWCTSVKGAPKEYTTVDDQGANSSKSDNFLLYRNFKSELTPITISPTTNTANKVNPIDRLVRMVWQLADNAFNQFYFADEQQTDLFTKLMRMKDQADFIRLGSHGSLKENLFIGVLGFNELKTTMANKHKDDPKIRHQALLMMFATHIQIKGFTVRITDESGRVVFIDNVMKPAIRINRLTEFDVPALIVLAFCFEDQDQNHDELVVYKWFSQAICSEEHGVLVLTNYEALLFDLASKYLNEFIERHDMPSSSSFYLSRPIIPFEDDNTGYYYQPTFIFTANYNSETSRSSIIVLESEPDLGDEDLDLNRVILTDNFKNTIEFDLYKHKTIEEIKMQFEYLLDDVFSKTIFDLCSKN